MTGRIANTTHKRYAKEVMQQKLNNILNTCSSLLSVYYLMAKSFTENFLSFTGKQPFVYLLLLAGLQQHILL